MENMKGSVVYTVAVFFIGGLIIVGQCRPEPENIYDEGKLTLKWCLQKDCKTKGDPWTWKRECICCVTLPDVPCYHSQNECQKNCPIS